MIIAAMVEETETKTETRLCLRTSQPASLAKLAVPDVRVELSCLGARIAQGAGKHP